MLARQNNWFWCPHCQSKQHRRTWAKGIGHLRYDVLTQVIAWHGRIEEQMWNEFINHGLKQEQTNGKT